ncbi:MAG: GSCFA domain-containing protein [Tannerellaceae bacterium]|jgi:hypothetical protein|nr:GSCFA domain-containing protein [Tannerellaceae bacterium]
MELTTPVAIPKPPFTVGYRDAILLLGSCFAAEAGRRMSDDKLNVCINPFGILYNPLSVEAALRRLLGAETLTAGDLFFHNGLYHSFDHHGSFSAPIASEALEAMNSRLLEGSKRLLEASRLIVTWGSASAYLLAGTERVAANCHKLPASRFTRQRMEPNEIEGRWAALIEDILKANPGLRLAITVSPVRYLAEGARESRLGKAALLIAADRLERRFPGVVTYFAAYEIMNDELRDYRFYAPDMIHPSPQAVDYIWEKFREAFFGDEDRRLFAEWEPLRRALGHRPSRPEGEAWRAFVAQTLLKAEEVSRKFPYFDISRETALLRSFLNT